MAFTWASSEASSWRTVGLVLVSSCGLGEGKDHDLTGQGPLKSGAHILGGTKMIF